jgi:hypothetical protein
MLDNMKGMDAGYGCLLSRESNLDKISNPGIR